MEETTTRRRWPRVTLVLSPAQNAALLELAHANYREPKREAMRLLAEAIEREAGRKPR